MKKSEVQQSSWGKEVWRKKKTRSKRSRYLKTRLHNNIRTQPEVISISSSEELANDEPESHVPQKTLADTIVAKTSIHCVYSGGLATLDAEKYVDSSVVDTYLHIL